MIGINTEAATISPARLLIIKPIPREIQIKPVSDGWRIKLYGPLMTRRCPTLTRGKDTNASLSALIEKNLSSTPMEAVIVPAR